LACNGNAFLSQAIAADWSNRCGVLWRGSGLEAFKASAAVFCVNPSLRDYGVTPRFALKEPAKLGQFCVLTAGSVRCIHKAKIALAAKHDEPLVSRHGA
jgi:hypothetical protein